MRVKAQGTGGKDVLAGCVSDTACPQTLPGVTHPCTRRSSSLTPMSWAGGHLAANLLAALPPRAARPYLCSRATRRSLSSLPLNPLAKGLFSIFSWVIFKRMKPSIKRLKPDQTDRCSSRSEAVGLEVPCPTRHPAERGGHESFSRLKDAVAGTALLPSGLREKRSCEVRC